MLKDSCGWKPAHYTKYVKSHGLNFCKKLYRTYDTWLHVPPTLVQCLALQMVPGAPTGGGSLLSTEPGRVPENSLEFFLYLSPLFVTDIIWQVYLSNIYWTHCVPGPILCVFMHTISFNAHKFHNKKWDNGWFPTLPFHTHNDFIFLIKIFMPI